jgi:myo-inositol-1(or 4)-monophosphatase
VVVPLHLARLCSRGTFDGHLQKLTTMGDMVGGVVLVREAGLNVRIGTRGGTDIPWIACGSPSFHQTPNPFFTHPGSDLDVGPPTRPLSVG